MLKSPLFGLSEEELFELAHGRAAARCAAALRERRPDLAARLDALAASRATAHAVRLLRASCSAPAAGARRSSSRLGPEANDALDEFLNLALDYESRETPSLQGFVAWLRTASAEVKRDMEMARDEVRVMTVHGAKGLEAPIVVLADTTTVPAGPPHYQPRLLSICRAADAAPDTPIAWSWMPNEDGRHRARPRPRAPRSTTPARTNTAGCSMSR